jgi:glyoxylase-like metal-dependent hydrolase (beta-lactamase superfamily II)
MKVHHIAAATLCPLGARLVNGEGGLFDLGRMVCHAWVIESNDGLVLVDTGIGEEDQKDVRRRLGLWFEVVSRPSLDPGATAIGQVRRLGFKPRDVRHIVPTHLDLDHAGGLPDFPWADVHVFRPEYEAALHPRTVTERMRYRCVHWAHGPRWDVREAEGERWFGFNAVRALDTSEEILLVPLFGHTRGHCGVAAKTSAGWQLHAGDAYFFHGEMHPEPTCTPALAAFQRIVVTDNPARLANQDRLRALVRDHGSEVTVHCAHDPTELERCAAG